MPATLKHSPLIAIGIASALAAGSALVPHQYAEAQTAQAPASEGFKLELKKGQVLQLIAPEEREEGKAARQTYYQSAFPMAERLGYQRHGQLNMRQKIRSDYDPSLFVFFSWPDAAAVRAYRDDPKFSEFKRLRKEAWHELKIYDKELTEDLSLTFTPEKHYSVLLAWLDKGTRQDYTRYLEGIEPAVKRSGGRFIYKMIDPTMQALNAPPGAPGQITFVEWETTDGFAKVQQSPEYREHQTYFGSSVQRFEFYWLQTPR
ncbi:MAG: hypothetical protein AAFR88_01685 [Pseudomonadota bacterium]